MICRNENNYCQIGFHSNSLSIQKEGIFHSYIIFSSPSKKIKQRKCENVLLVICLPSDAFYASQSTDAHNSPFRVYHNISQPLCFQFFFFSFHGFGLCFILNELTSFTVKIIVRIKRILKVPTEFQDQAYNHLLQYGYFNCITYCLKIRAKKR